MAKEFSTTIDIDAPASVVWEILTDSAKYTDWDDNMVKLEGDIKPGEQLTIHTKLDPKRAFKPTVSVFEPNTRMVWRSGMPLGLFTGERTFTLSPKDDDQTTFTMTERFTGPFLMLIGGTIPDLQPTFDTFAQTLKARAESMA